MKKKPTIQTVNAFSVIPLLNDNYHIKLTIPGNSMYPFLRNNKDTIELKPAKFEEISKGDIVLIENDKGKYIIHRVYKRENQRFFIIGDAQRKIEGPFYPDNLIGIVCTIWRNDKQINMNGFIWKSLVKLWIFLIPLRPSILKTKRYLFSLSNKSSQS
ncbi:MAG: S24/S26 family peptidase [Bacteroidales bacterium]|nr:S24/S26 family peptidase [Bacteroidales bacterium]MCF8327578.1 S24/S26 family peptidase [Bacteroidales bacterium]